MNTRDFATVCHLAGFDPDAVQRAFQPERLRKKIRA